MARQGLDDIGKLQEVKHDQVTVPEAACLEMGILYQTAKQKKPPKRRPAWHYWNTMWKYLVAIKDFLIPSHLNTNYII